MINQIIKMNIFIVGSSLKQKFLILFSVFNDSTPSAAQPSDTPVPPVAQNAGQINPQPVPSSIVPIVQQEIPSSLNRNELPSQPAAAAQPEQNVILQNPATNQVVSSQVQPDDSPVQEASSSVAPTGPNDLAKPQDIQPESTLFSGAPTVQPVLADNSNNIIPQNPQPVDSVPVSIVPINFVPVNSVPSFQNPPNVQFGSAIDPVSPTNVPNNNINAPVLQQPFGSAFYPVPPSNNINGPAPQQQFGSSQASFPAPNFSNNPYLQGLIPGGSNPNVQPSIPPQNTQNPPSNVVPPQNAVPLPPVALPPQNAQTPVPVVPPNVQINNNPYLQNPSNVPPSSSYVPPQNSVVPAPAGSSVNLSNNPYLQNLGPNNVSPSKPSGEAGNQNSNAFFPSIPASSAVPQTPTQSYPTPCTNIPSSQFPVQGTTYAVPASQFVTQGTTYQPQNYYPATSKLRSHPVV